MLNAGQYGTSPLNLLLISLGCLLSPWDGWMEAMCNVLYVVLGPVAQELYYLNVNTWLTAKNVSNL